MSSLVSILFSLLLCSTWVISTPIPKKGENSLQFVNPKNKKRFYDYGTESTPVRGVNLGGWLVIEPFITPSLFEAFRTNPNNDDGIPVDEYHYTQYLGQELAEARLTQHWDTFYTEQDIINLADQGFNLVRIPIGYWAFQLAPNDPYVTGKQEQYLDNAIQWCKDHGVKVWVDLHGAVGSQNGFDNSGLRDNIAFLQDDNLAITSQVIQYLMKKYSQDEFQDTVIGVELINEPLGPVLDMDKMKNDYLIPCYNYMRDTLDSNQIIIIHDAFQPAHYWDDFLTLNQNKWGVLIDHHHYHIFSSGELAGTMDQKIQDACKWGSDTVDESHWTICGEFSAALTDCAKWLNGVGIGARYDGSFQKGNTGSYYIGSCANNEDINSWSDERKQNTRKFVEAQLDAFELRNGWTIWNYKTESALEWDVTRLIANDLFPNPLTDRKYPNQCGF